MNPLSLTTYASVVSINSVTVSFLVAVLNYQYTLDCDIKNGFLNMDTKENVFFYEGDE